MPAVTPTPAGSRRDSAGGIPRSLAVALIDELSQAIIDLADPPAGPSRGHGGEAGGLVNELAKAIIDLVDPPSRHRRSLDSGETAPSAGERPQDWWQ